nr:thioesterase family protein [Maliibacterium massiliense]
MQVGIKGHYALVVTQDMLASRVGSGAVDVYATPMMIAGMEKVCAEAVAALLAPGQVTVGTHMDATHEAATPPGMRVCFDCELVAVDGRKLTFCVEARDACGVIGRARHTRVIVDREKFLARALAKGEERKS